jgi:hypothetical protein
VRSVAQLQLALEQLVPSPLKVPPLAMHVFTDTSEQTPKMQQAPGASDVNPHSSGDVHPGQSTRSIVLKQFSTRSKMKHLFAESPSQYASPSVAPAHFRPERSHSNIVRNYRWHRNKNCKTLRSAASIHLRPNQNTCDVRPAQ